MPKKTFSYICFSILKQLKSDSIHYNCTRTVKIPREIPIKSFKSKHLPNINNCISPFTGMLSIL